MVSEPKRGKKTLHTSQQQTHSGLVGHTKQRRMCSSMYYLAGVGKCVEAAPLTWRNVAGGATNYKMHSFTLVVSGVSLRPSVWSAADALTRSSRLALALRLCVKEPRGRVARLTSSYCGAPSAASVLCGADTE